MNTTCPLCQRTVSDTFKLRLLNGFGVCKKCRNGFANRRQLAFIVDYGIYYIGSQLLMGVWVAGVMTRAAAAPPPPQGTIAPPFTGVEMLLMFLLPWLLWFLVLFKDGFGGASPGKRLLGLQVVDVTTRQPIGFKQSLKRNLVLMIPFVPFILAFTLVKGTRWGESWANTVVIWKKYAHRPAFDPRGIVCTGCGYDLTGNVSGRCPECFTPITMPFDGTTVPMAIPVAQSST